MNLKASQFELTRKSFFFGKNHHFKLVKHNCKKSGSLHNYARRLEEAKKSKPKMCKHLLKKPREDADSSSLQPIEIYSPGYVKSQWTGT